MLKNKSKTFARILFYAAALLIIYIFQALIFANIKLMGVRPLIFPVAVVGVALFAGNKRGGVFGLFAGMLCDISLNQSTIQFTILLTVVGLVIGELSERVLTKGFPSYIVCGVVTLMAVSAVQMICTSVFTSISIAELFDTAWKQTVYSAIFLPPMYYLTRFVSRI